MAPKVARTYNGEFPKLSISTDMDHSSFSKFGMCSLLRSELSEYG